MKTYNKNDVRWLAGYDNNKGMAVVVPYILKDGLVEDLLKNKTYGEEVLKHSKLLKEHNNNLENITAKDWSTEEMVHNYYCALKNTSEKHATKFLEKYQSLDEYQIASMSSKLESELEKMAKEKSKEIKRENKRKMQNPNKDDFEF